VLDDLLAEDIAGLRYRMPYRQALARYRADRCGGCEGLDDLVDILAGTYRCTHVWRWEERVQALEERLSSAHFPERELELLASIVERHDYLKAKPAMRKRMLKMMRYEKSAVRVRSIAAAKSCRKKVVRLLRGTLMTVRLASPRDSNVPPRPSW